MSITDKLDRAEKCLVELFPKQIASDCIYYIVSKLLSNIVDREQTTVEDIDLLFNASLNQNKMCESDNLIDLVMEMSAEARERSHGAAILSKVFINEWDYKKIIDDLGTNGSTLTIGKIRVCISNELTNYASAFGICKSKFECVAPNLTIILGKIKE